MMRKSHSFHTLGQKDKNASRLDQERKYGWHFVSEAGGDRRYPGKVGKVQVTEDLADDGKQCCWKLCFSKKFSSIFLALASL